MSYFNFLNNDVLNLIFSYLDTYEIIKTCDVLNLNNTYIIKKILNDIEQKSGSLHHCQQCKKLCMNVKFCNKNNSHKLCYNCVKKCQFCNQFIGDCCKLLCWISDCTSHEYTQYITCKKCNRLVCINCVVFKHNYSGCQECCKN